MAAGARAEAKVLDLYAQAQGGGSFGKGIKGDQKDTDFFDKTAGGAYGVLVGAEVFWIDGWIEHNQYRGGDGLTGTWTQFMAGFDLDFAIGDAPGPKQKPNTYAQIGVALGFGLGTGQQVDPPLDNAEISDKGFLAQVSFAGDYKLNRVLALGISVPVTWGYLQKNDVVSNMDSAWYQSVSAAALLHLRFDIDIK